MNRRAWTPDEDEVLAEGYPLGARHVSELVGRPVHSVYQRAVRLGYAKQMAFVADSDVIAAIQQYHPVGWTDSEIAVALKKQFGCGVDRRRVGVIRRRLGLSCNALSEHRRRQIAAKTKEQLAKAGLSSIGHLRRQSFNKWKRDLGWPENLTLRAVQSLEMFYRHGRLTRIQLCELLGVSTKSRTQPKSNARGGTVLAELQAAGLISCIRKAVAVPVDLKLHDDPSSRPRKSNRVIKTKHISLYFLNPGVVPNDCRRNKVS